jgi:hypothetical protein
LNVRDVKNLTVSTAGKSSAHDLARRRAGAIASRDVGGLTRGLVAVGFAETGDHPVLVFGKTQQFRSAFDRDPERAQALDKQPFVLVLGKDLQEGVWGKVGADGLEWKARCRLALHPQIDCGNLVAAGDHCLSEIKLSVKLKRTRLDCESARCRAWLGVPVNNPNLHAKLC